MFTLFRYEALFRVGNFDLYDGLQTSSSYFVSYTQGRYSEAELLQLILLIVAVVLSVAYLIFVLRPYLAMQRGDVERVAGLVSHVPHDVDALQHARRVLRPKQKAAQGSASNKVAPSALM